MALEAGSSMPRLRTLAAEKPTQGDPPHHGNAPEIWIELEELPEEQEVIVCESEHAPEEALGVH